MLVSALDTKISKGWKNADAPEDAEDEGLLSSPKNKSHKRNKCSKEPSGSSVTNQEHQIDVEITHKKTNKKFFTSKQRKQAPTAEISRIALTDKVELDEVEDRENVPRVPPLKLRFKAANAAALSMESFTNQDDPGSGGLTSKSKIMVRYILNPYYLRYLKTEKNVC